MLKKTMLIALGFVMCINLSIYSQNYNKFRFTFMTDIHITYQKKAEEGMKKAIKTAENLKSDFIITGGDLIMDALGKKYNYADSLYNLYLSVIKQSKIPIYNCIGNHEIWAWALKTDTLHPEYGRKMYEKRLSPSYYSKDIKGWHFIFLSSIQRDYNGLYKGGIDNEQLEWIKNDIAKTDTSIPIVIITHIPLMTLQSQYFYGSLAANNTGDVIVNSKEVLNIFKRHNLKLVLQGHLHFYEKLEIEGITFLTGGAVSGSWWNGPYSKTQEGFVVIDIEGKNFKADYYDYVWEAQK